MNESAWKITGHHAIRIAERDGVTLCKAADPVEGYLVGLTIDEARAVVAEDPSLIYCTVVPFGEMPEGYRVEDYFRDERYLGADDDGVEPRWRDAGGAL